MPDPDDTALDETYSGYVGVADGRLYYEEAGDGEAVVLLHAGLVAAGMWDPQFGALAAGYRAVRFDARGHGRSSEPGGPFCWYEDLRGIFGALGIERAHLVGLSLGARVALDFALAYPDMVGGLVLASPGLSGYQFAGEVERRSREMTEAHDRGDNERAVEIFLQMWTDGPSRKAWQATPGVRDRVREMALANMRRPPAPAVDPGAVVARELEPPAIGRLREVRAPSLILVGEKDMPDILVIGELLAGTIEGARKVVLPGVAHMLNLERPTVFNQLVVDFLGRV
jgi:pimeloyl-ACP methyl ester carboxylesterase